MKSILSTLVAATLLSLCTTADARPHDHGRHTSTIHISGYRSCGTPIHTQRFCAGYDRFGRPIWRTRIVARPHHRRPVVRVCPPRPCVRPLPRRYRPVQTRHCRH